MALAYLTCVLRLCVRLSRMAWPDELSVTKPRPKILSHPAVKTVVAPTGFAAALPASRLKSSTD
ncbi:hypothetical protein [Pantoea ananatis]|uniref:hypothetical protein n=1 Tax=Pantoea ananas TaxID=553 RepID=UPI000CF3F10B|nr:hypothetical protein [Pantoea ananatis]PQL07979.1 hypothetical protein CG436_07175 [Pantoea ananatis]RQN05059.1 hypothetical protein EHQ51_09370 [Pantoea ananatis]